MVPKLKWLDLEGKTMIPFIRFTTSDTPSEMKSESRTSSAESLWILEPIWVYVKAKFRRYGENYIPDIHFSKEGKHLFP
jgi:hypothetical protein